MKTDKEVVENSRQGSAIGSEKSTIPQSLKFRAGEIAEVRSKEEILSTLDHNGNKEGLPFMPEMLQYCGKKFKVYKRADKTCDTISGKYESRRMFNTVHLDNLRCNGEAHDGCDATCLLFWKEAWLRRSFAHEPPMHRNRDYTGSALCTEKTLWKSVRKVTNPANPSGEIYSCQATELLRASSPLPWWDIRQYIREVRSGNIGLIKMFYVLMVANINWAHLRTRGWRRYPLLDSNLLDMQSEGSDGEMNLKPGEYVKIKLKEEILKTLNSRFRNRGLWFDNEMVRYCGRTVKVLKRVNRIINEITGKMIFIKNDCVILEGVVCCGDLSEKRYFCPRSIYPFWREIWLERIC